MKKLFLVTLSFLLIPVATLAQKPGTQTKDDAPATGRPTLRRRDPVPDAGAVVSPAQPGAGGLEQRLADLTLQISREMSDNQKRTVAVVEFVDLKGRVTDFGRFLAEELITRLYQTRKFKVIERQLLNKVIAEQKLSLTGVIDQKSAQQLGRLLGVEAVASGTVTDMGRTLRINARLIDASTAEVFAVASAEIAKDDSVTRLMGADNPPAPAGDAAAGAPTTPTPRKKPTMKVEAQFFTFDLQRCRLSGTAVACDLVITNNDQDRRLSVRSNSSMFDDAGNQQRAGKMQLANEEGYGVDAYLISGVPTKARINFDNVSPNATRITLLHLYLSVHDGADFNVQYRNVPLREQADAGVGGEPAEVTAAAARSGEGVTVNVPGNEQWTDTGIDVSPGMRLEVAASGRVYISKQSSPAGQILSGILGGKSASSRPPPPPRSVGPAALLAKIRYARGGESNPLKVGERNTLIVEQGEDGRLLFGIDDRSVKDNSGYFIVKVRWQQGAER